MKHRIHQWLYRRYIEDVAPTQDVLTTLTANGCLCLDEIVALVLFYLTRLWRRILR